VKGPTPAPAPLDAAPDDWVDPVPAPDAAMLPDAPDAPELSPDAALPDVEEPEFPCVPDEDPVCAVAVPLPATEPELVGRLPLDEVEPDAGGESLKASSPDPASEPLVPAPLVLDPLVWAAV
jgi:hypothetical protein